MNDKQAYSIQQFCEAHSISRAKFYLLLNEGKAPMLMKVGRRRLISIESATKWREKMTEFNTSEMYSQLPQKLRELILGTLRNRLKTNTIGANNSAG